MSRIFYDHLLVFEEVEKNINSMEISKEERDELWNLVDEMVHHRAFGLILERLPRGNHKEFLEKFHEAPYSQNLMEYLKIKVGENVEELLKQELGNLAYEILSEIQSPYNKKPK